MIISAAPVTRRCAALRARLGLGGATGWRRLGLTVFALYLLKGLCWIAAGYLAFGR